VLCAGFYTDFNESEERKELITSNQKRDKADFNHLKTGDLVFQIVTNDSLNKASKYLDTTYNNIGIVFIDGQNYSLLETKNKVQYVSLRQWIENGSNEHYTVKRLKNAKNLITGDVIQKLRSEVRNNILKEFDTSYDWSDDKMYNAELVWKIYKQSLNVKLGELDTVQVDSTLKYVITTNSIFDSKNLLTVSKE